MTDMITTILEIIAVSDRHGLALSAEDIEVIAKAMRGEIGCDDLREEFYL